MQHHVFGGVDGDIPELSESFGVWCGVRLGLVFVILFCPVHCEKMDETLVDIIFQVAWLCRPNSIRRNFIFCRKGMCFGLAIGGCHFEPRTQSCESCVQSPGDTNQCLPKTCPDQTLRVTMTATQTWALTDFPPTMINQLSQAGGGGESVLHHLCNRFGIVNPTAENKPTKNNHNIYEI